MKHFWDTHGILLATFLEAAKSRFSCDSHALHHGLDKSAANSTLATAPKNSNQRTMAISTSACLPAMN